MATKTETMHVGEFLISEENGRRSRDQVTVTVPANTTLLSGTVLGRLTATGKYVPYDNVGSDGSEAAAAVLYGPELVNATGGGVDNQATVILRDAEVRDANLVWDASVDGAGKTAGKADLATVGIIAR